MSVAVSPGMAPPGMIVTAAGAPSVPRLREDIRLLQGPRSADGNQSWLIHDPVRNAFFRIGWREFEILSRWDRGSPEAIAEAVRRGSTVEADAAEVERVARFLIECELVTLSGPQQKQGWLKRVEAARNKSLSRRFQQNLFLRVPLVSPDGFLKATMPAARLFFTRGFWILTALVTLFALAMVGQEWDRFVGTFPYFFSVPGIITYALALTFAKAIHELGHAYAAARHGLRVPSMGVAFLVFWPVLYTDTTDTWRLRSGRDRFLVSAAGMIAEIGLAAWALLLWCFVPPGAVQSALFALATATWLLTVAINVNPLMRFDGYFLLSDALGVENLQPRAFALLRYRFRTVCLGITAMDPEPALSERMRRTLTVYGAATLVYRISIALGIGMLLYYFTFKLLGILALAGVMVTMVVQPAVREARGMVAPGSRLVHPLRLLLFVAFLGGLVALVLYPWQTTVSAPAALKAAAESRVYAPIPARVVELKVASGDRVQAGEPIAQLDSPDLRFRLRKAEIEAENYRLVIDRIQFRPDIADQEAVAREEMAQALAEAAGYRERIASLTLRAPFDGIVTSVSDGIHPDAWVTPSDALALVIRPGDQILTAYVDEDDVSRLAPGASGRFYPFGSTGDPLAVELVSMSPAAVRTIRDRSLSSVHGGPIAAREGNGGVAIPEKGVYEAKLRPKGGLTRDAASLREMTGIVKLDGEKRSIAGRVWTQVHSTLIRESGF